jgi:hypothetical protein
LDEFEDERKKVGKRGRKVVVAAVPKEDFIDDEEAIKPKKRGRKPKTPTDAPTSGPETAPKRKPKAKAPDAATSGTEGGTTPKKKKRTKKQEKEIEDLLEESVREMSVGGMMLDSVEEKKPRKREVE